LDGCDYPRLRDSAVDAATEGALQFQPEKRSPTNVATDPSELANDVVRGVRDQQRKPFKITPQLEAWLLETADQPASQLTQADFDGIRQRARKRNPSSGA
jgi:hypothetical protein